MFQDNELVNFQFVELRKSVFHLTSVGCEVKRGCVLVEMVYVFDEISLTLNPELVCYDEKTC